MFRRITLQRCLLVGLMAGILLAAVRILAIKGWVAPARIVSGSMAERLRGEHFLITCYDCGFVFPFGVESPPPLERAVCPNCGFDGNKVEFSGRRRGSRVLIDRGAYWLDSPQRWDVIAFNQDRRRGNGKPTSRLVVKRVVALPGELLAIRAGELFINDQLLRKSLAQFRRTAVVVHDNDHLPQKSAGMPARWRAEQTASGWEAVPGGFHWNAPTGQLVGSEGGTTPVGTSSPDMDWLVYHHWRCYANPYPRTALAPVSDNSGYNQGESRMLRNVTDLVVRCQITAAKGGEFAVRVHDGHEWLFAWLDLDRRQTSIRRDGETIASADFPGESDPLTIEFEFGVLDEQLVLAIDRQERIRKAYRPASTKREPIPQPVALGSRSPNVVIQHIGIRRDVFYLDPANRGQAWQMSEPARARSNGVLGDNPSLSEDSRQWADGGISQGTIVGKVLPLPW